VCLPKDHPAKGIVQKRPGRTMANNECPVSIVCGFRSARPEPLGIVLYYMVISEANPGIGTKKTEFKPWVWVVSHPAVAMGFVQVPRGPRPPLQTSPNGSSSGVGRRVPWAWISMGWPRGGRGSRMIARRTWPTRASEIAPQGRDRPHGGTARRWRVVCSISQESEPAFGRNPVQGIPFSSEPSIRFPLASSLL
jgi:hypothetical protein